MKTVLFCLLAASALILFSGTSVPLHAEPDPPNIIIIYCDDLGYGDVGLYGKSPQHTPEILRMANEGRTFTNFYSTSSVCTPSRSSLMTGCYPRRVNMHEDDSGAWVFFPSGARGLNPNELTLAEALKKLGYATAIIGKWHLGDQPEFLPTRHGFDEWFGIPYSNNMYLGWNDRHTDWPPLPLMRNESIIETDPDQSQLTARYTDEAIDFIGRNRARPFFLYLPHAMPHFPVHASARFEGHSENGIYGDAVQEIDWSTGRILDTLKRLELDRKTLVIFTSDNGAEAKQNRSNLPLRGHKGTTWEGGMRMPFVAWWPGTISANSRTHALAATMDLLPTCVALAGGSLPGDTIIDGHDIRNLLIGDQKATTPYEAFYYYYIDQLQAVRSGPWKLFLERKGNPNRNEPEIVMPRLYNLESDIGESNNLFDSHPAVVRHLQAHAQMAREKLGDRNREGKGQRPPGRVSDPRPLRLPQ